jgi:glyoxylase-like metal-dependent hydrolase (beta-lactamase superfamily II)
MFLKQFVVGPMENFVYFIGSQTTKECYVVDPAWDIDLIVKEAEKDGMTIKGALVTHYHPDHCGGHIWGHDIQGVAELISKLSVPVYANKHEVDGILKVTGLSRTDIKSCESGDILTIGDIALTLIHTPGHTPGSQCFLCENSLISGDTLFISGCGRVDLPGGNSDALHESLSTKISKLPADTILYPGHNYDSVPHAAMHEVMQKNPYLRAQSLTEWRGMFGL